ncbi:IS110 family transposase (plasmid) [Sinorhizobium numidicum]|uniref:IS110 family transposase n=1 Tax=Sinorhizobium numidicum TaxID=680248 RepID=A0ABY8D741_9HYPH|nr:IS110 family transposase [Sinorhizobium numidicum]WEX79370.1 IS110 family transposase [Sinorhizobium numidicum]WEX85673.1 IS110 family transposase [Sinorhizobium numidicum]
MKHYVGMDVSVKETSLCIVDEAGGICRELKVSSHPDDLIEVLNDPAWHLVRIGLEAGPLSQWLFEGLSNAGLPVVCIETRHTKAFLKATVNTTDRNDARGIAQMMRVNLFRPVHVKTISSQQRRALLTARKLILNKIRDIENDIRGLLRNFGLKVGLIGRIGFVARIRELLEGMVDLAEIIEPLLSARQQLRESFEVLHRKVLSIVRNDVTCRRLMTIPGVGPVVALGFVSTIDIPGRFKNSKAVGPALGLTPVMNQSGESNRVGRISLCGDIMMRTLLYEAAQVMLTVVRKWSWLKAWAMNIAKRRGHQKAIVALARRLAVIMHRMWSNGTDFQWSKDSGPAKA